ncbi:MAG: hypothetical protein Q8S84_02155 [bacterium]|nr:hypothetical protein [bacterium]MDP3380359.1 hypothetical protein [bacterium]
MNSSGSYHNFSNSAAANQYGFNGLKKIESSHNFIYVSIISLYLLNDFLVTVNSAHILLFIHLLEYSSFILFIQYVTCS